MKKLFIATIAIFAAMLMIQVPSVQAQYYESTGDRVLDTLESGLDVVDNFTDDDYYYDDYYRDRYNDPYYDPYRRRTHPSYYDNRELHYGINPLGRPYYYYQY
jgi:hypothetical protein